VTLNVDQSNDLNQILDDRDVLDALADAGVDQLAIASTLSASIDWLDFISLGEANQAVNDQIQFKVKVGGTNAFDGIASFDQSLNAAIRTEQQAGINFATGVDLLENYASPNQFGNLIDSLLDSGITDFVVESGNVEITDGLASAMVESGMLQALPTVNLIINATANLKSITGMDDFAHLYTDLKSMSALDVDGIKVQDAISKVFIDLGDLGIPTNDSQALSEIQNLLKSLDPANDAKSLAYNSKGDAIDISLVMNANLATALQSSFSENDLKLLENLGITEIIGLDQNGLDPNASSSVVAQTPVEVKIIGPNTTGADGTLFDELINPK
jgi:hypothetical protein